MFATMDKDINIINVWLHKPRLGRDGRWSDKCDAVVVDVPSEMMDGLTLQPGQCVEIQDIRLALKVKTDKQQRNFKFSETGDRRAKR